MSASALNRRARLEFRSWRFVVAGFVLALFVCGIKGSPVFAHDRVDDDHTGEGHVHWDGTVEVEWPASSTLPKGGSVTYRLRLNQQPYGHPSEEAVELDPDVKEGEAEDGWWVRIRVDGVVRSDGEYNGIRWVPSVGWEFTKDKNNWDRVAERHHLCEPRYESGRYRYFPRSLVRQRILPGT